ncbi:hypothetical protein B296_00023941 [Ensete ventricosum]|uniref:Uncharacterized protein n=1 Tax=Ensete ventricosum TaxID=4639 RepID=A0A426Z089_ENSVE|nr:hypothetical protein B296_00023941 [Ensete ventricosum]
MERSSSVGASWADQWDCGNHCSGWQVLEKQKKSSGNGCKSCMEKTKALAVLGFNKAKEGSSKGFHWIKDKHRKRAQKN